MRIATWNIGGGFIYSNLKDAFDLEQIEYFIDELKKISPDIVCFQEIHVSKKNDQPKIIAKALGFDYVITESIADSHLKEGEKLSISIISRYPILSSKFDKLWNPQLKFIWNGKEQFSHDKGFLEAKISYDNRTIRVLSGHMVPFRKFGKDFLDDEFKDIRELIETVICNEKMHEIICADMNFENIHELIPNVFKHGFESVLDDSPTTPTNKYDKIIISKEWTCSDSKIIIGKADHYLCFADVELK